MPTARQSHYKAEADARPRPTCPRCGELADETCTQYGYRNDHCGLWSWDRYPLVDGPTHAARRIAHEAFDQLWRDGHMSRAKAYRKLRQQLGIPERDCHIKLMPRELAERVPAAARAIAAALTPPEPTGTEG